MNPQAIYLVEDEPDMAEVLADYLRLDGFAVQVFGDGLAAAQALAQAPPSLLLLDLMLPGLDGLSLLRQVRRQGALPVILVTARVEELDRLLGLEAGADDYICKPFSPREVVARVKAVLRRSQPPNTPGLRLDAQRREARLDGQVLELTRREFELLTVLAGAPGRTFSRQQLLERVCPDEFEVSERAIDSHIKNLRRKLGQLAPGQDWIRSVYGIGFVLDAPATA